MAHSCTFLSWDVKFRTHYFLFQNTIKTTNPILTYRIHVPRILQLIQGLQASIKRKITDYTFSTIDSWFTARFTRLLHVPHWLTYIFLTSIWHGANPEMVRMLPCREEYTWTSWEQGDGLRRGGLLLPARYPLLGVFLDRTYSKCNSISSTFRIEEFNVWQAFGIALNQEVALCLRPGICKNKVYPFQLQWKNTHSEND